jgi:hypothetical protein
LQQNFGILLILWCSFKLWWNFCLDRNFSYKGKGPLNRQPPFGKVGRRSVGINKRLDSPIYDLCGYDSLCVTRDRHVVCTMSCDCTQARAWRHYVMSLFIILIHIRQEYQGPFTLAI